MCVKILTDVSFEELDGQEVYSSTKTNKKKKIVELTYSEIKSQISGSILPLINSIDDSIDNRNEGFRLSKIVFKLGFSIEGNVFIVNGGIDSAIELEFIK